MSGEHEHGEYVKPNDLLHAHPDLIEQANNQLVELGEVKNRVTALESSDTGQDQELTEANLAIEQIEEWISDNEIPPPVEPPDEPVNDVVLVPDDYTDQFFIDNANDEPTFQFKPGIITKPILALPDCHYRGETSIVSSDDEFTLPNGDVVVGRKVEQSLTKITDVTSIFKLQSTERIPGVTFEGFEITNCGNPGSQWYQKSAINLKLLTGASLINNWIHDNHGTGVRVGKDCQVFGNLIHGMGHIGIGGLASGIEVARNEWFNNAKAHNNWNWETGGSKVVLGNGVFHHNYAHDEIINFWSDINAYYNYDSNVGINARGPGMMIELTKPGSTIEITNNLLRGNGRQGWGNLWEVMRAQLLIASAAGVRAHGNLLEQNGPGQYGVSIVEQRRKYNGVYYYNDDIAITGNTIRRFDSDRNRVGVYDDTGSKSELDGFIRNYSRNWNNSNVDPSRRATFTLTPNVLE